MARINTPINDTNFISCSINIRNWEDANLPQSHSRIAFDVFMLIGHSFFINRPLTVKQLINSLEYSERGIRYVLEQFIDGDWCEVLEQDNDKRFRHITPTRKFIEKINEYKDVVSNEYILFLNKNKICEAK